MKCPWLFVFFYDKMREFFDFFLDFADLLDFSASNIWILSRKNGSMCHLHFKMAFEKNRTLGFPEKHRILISW